MDYLASHLQSLDTTILKVEQLRSRIDWLLPLKDRFTSILNPGCNDGYETIALLWFLNAKAAIGVDVDAQAIQWARVTVEHMREDLNQLRRAIESSIDIPTDLRRRMVLALGTYAQVPLPAYQVADITLQIDLPSSSYDIAYCHKVLYNLASGASGASWRGTIFEGIRQVSNLLVAGGLFVAIEPLTRSPEDPTPLDLAGLFLQAGLEEVQGGYPTPEIEGMAVHCFAKA